MTIPGNFKYGGWTVPPSEWDQGHWHKETTEKARELIIANQFRQFNSEATIRILLLDMPMIRYGHIEMPRELAGSLIAAATWLAA